MEVVRHHDECVELHMSKMFRNMQPALAYNLPKTRELDTPGHYAPEQIFSLVCANGHKIQAGARVIETAQPR